MTTRSRTTDPSTSREAGERVTNLRASQARVLNMFVLYGDMHDQQLLEYLHDAERQAGLPLMSDSGVRSRRSELAKPNMERLQNLTAGYVLDWMDEQDGKPEFDGFSREATEEEWQRARVELRVEGFKSKLWDTGKREIVNGRRVIIWGLAR